MRISSQGSVIMISDDIDAARADIVSATKAKPCVITIATGTGPAVGDIVVPKGTGWNTLEGMPFKVIAVLASTITLEDSDTTGEANTIQTCSVSMPTFLERCR